MSIYSKSDSAFERAAMDPSERAALLQKLRRWRDLSFGWAIGGLCAIVLCALVAMAMIGGGGIDGYGLRYAGLLDVVGSVTQLLGLVAIGLLMRSGILNQDVKMLILAGGSGACDSEQPAEQAETGKCGPDAS